MVGAEADAVTAETRALILAQAAHLLRAPRGDRGCRDSRLAGRRCRAPCPRGSGPAARSISGFSSAAMWPLSQALRRPSTRSRDGPDNCSSARMTKRGFSRSSPAMQPSNRLALPAQIAIEGQHDVTIAGAGKPLRAVRQWRLPERFCAAPRSACASAPSACGSGVKRKPCRAPTWWPSTITSPAGVISASSIVFSLSRRISTLVRRSTKRFVSRSCSASERLSSTARVFVAPFGRVGKPVRLVGDESPGANLGDAGRQRVDVALGNARGVRICPAIQSSGTTPPSATKPKISPTSSACWAGAIFR